METKISNLKDLRDFLNACTDQQLSGKALVQTAESEVGEITHAFQIGEDHYKTDEGLEPISTFEANDDIHSDGYEVVPAHAVYLSFKIY